jgi:hypothetical protein
VRRPTNFGGACFVRISYDLRSRSRQIDFPSIHIQFAWRILTEKLFRRLERKLKEFRNVQTILATTEIGRTRFYQKPHRTDGVGVHHWSQVTRQLNQQWLRENAPPLVSTVNRALRGNRRQLQDYVNLEPETLSRAVLAALPSRLSELGVSIRWVSPLARENYREYRDNDFLRAIDMADQGPQLADFWPTMGPSWDAVGVISGPNGVIKASPVLVEAKSHINEISGRGCLAVGASIEKIDRALADTKRWLGVEGDADWRGALYQYANRLAHLYSLRKVVSRGAAWLVNVYFTDDPIGPTTE